jgi:zinc protease
MMGALTMSFAMVMSSAAESEHAGTNVAVLLQPSQSPLVTFRLLFLSGAAGDPQGKEGLAALTAAMLAKGGSKALPYEEILAAMYPMATTFDAQADKEMTVFTGTTHIDNLPRYYSLISQMLLDPGFRDEDFTRLKAEAINFLTVSLREGNDEELGKEELYHRIYRGHPYGHHDVGRVSSLEKMTLDDVRSFYREQYRRGSLVIGLAGGYPKDFPEKVRQDFSKLPVGQAPPLVLPQPALPAGTQIEIVERETRSTAVSLGFPIKVVRGDPDWPALALVNSYFGQHRSSNSHLYQRLREARGLNYGDYSYIEYFPRGMFQFQPDPNLGRHQQIFQIWIRPVEPQNGLFVLRAALYEFAKLTKDGLSQEAFEATREFLSKDVNVLLQTQDARLGYALDSQFYGIGGFADYLRNALAKLTLDDVNRAIRHHLASDQMQIVVVTKDAAAFRDALVQKRPSLISYNSPKPNDIMEEDKIIGNLPVDVKPEAITLRPVGDVFQ